MARFLMITYAGPDAVEPTPEAMASLAALTQEGMKAGWLVDTGAIQSDKGATKVKHDGKNMTVLDGPFAESKELIAGYALVEVPTLDEAVALSKRFYDVMGGGEGEIRQMFAAGDFGPGNQQ